MPLALPFEALLSVTNNNIVNCQTGPIETCIVFQANTFTKPTNMAWFIFSIHFRFTMTFAVMMINSLLFNKGS